MTIRSVLALIVVAGAVTGGSRVASKSVVEFPHRLTSRVTLPANPVERARWETGYQESTRPNRPAEPSLPLEEGFEASRSWCAADKSVCVTISAQIGGARDVRHRVEVYVRNEPMLHEEFAVVYEGQPRGGMRIQPHRETRNPASTVDAESSGT